MTHEPDSSRLVRAGDAVRASLAGLSDVDAIEALLAAVLNDDRRGTNFVADLVEELTRAVAGRSLGELEQKIEDLQLALELLDDD
jgi:hypothetical protein